MIHIVNYPLYQDYVSLSITKIISKHSGASNLIWMSSSENQASLLGFHVMSRVWLFEYALSRVIVYVRDLHHSKVLMLHI